jgi:chromosomal replication initiator protein DnaA
LSTELRIPEGIIVRTARGGPDVLGGILDNLKQFSFSGYVKVALKKESLSSTGYIVMEAGEPTMSIYQFEKKEPRDMKRIYAGDKAIRFVWEDAQDKLSLIELHSRVPKEEFDRRFPDAKLQEAAEFRSKATKQQVVRKAAPKQEEPPPREAEEAGEEDDTLKEIRKMRQEGYVVDDLEKLYKTDKEAATKGVEKYRWNIEELVEIGRLLDDIPRDGFEDEIDRLRQKLNDPARLEDVRVDIAKFKETARKRIERTRLAEKKIEDELRKKKAGDKSGDLYQLIMEYKEGQEEGAEPASVCEKCGGTLDDEGVCQKCSGGAGGGVPKDDLGFENFVVGGGNKFAFAAAAAVAESPDKAYNPLFLYGRSGLGKTHLLSAIAKRIAQNAPEGSVVLISAEKFTEDLERAIKADEIHEFRDGLRGKKALILDDFQFLLGKEAAQGELLYLLDEIKRGGGQIVIASDRLPKEIPRLLESLSAKIQGGLIADLQPLDEHTRLDILKSKAKGKGKEIPEDVLRFITDKIPGNVREMESALNRLIAFATVMKVEIDLRLADEVLTPTLTAPEEAHEAPKQADVKPGHSYLIEEEHIGGSVKIYTKKVDEGFRGLEISRLNPRQVRQDFGAKGEILWLTDKDSKTEKTVPPSLEVIIHKVEECMAPGDKVVLLIDGLQYLISNTSFESVLRFIRRLIDDFSESSSIMMLSVSPGTLNTQELSILERELETVRLG